MKKTKVGLLATLAATSAIVPTLSAVSCGRTNTTINKIGEEFDKEYGVNEAVYTKLKTEFVEAVGEQARQLGRDEEKARASARQACSAFDVKFQEGKNYLSYTAITDSMIDYASRVYNIKLTRTTQKKVASWDDLYIAFSGISKSADEYMASSGVLPEQRAVILNEAWNAFDGEDGLVSRIRANYADPLLGLVRAKSQILSCFADVNEDIGLVAAANRLKDFMSDYEIFYDFNKADNSNKLDILEQQSWFKVGADLSEDSHILQIFRITRKSDGKVLDSFEANKVCPGYTVKPILKKINKDPRKNEYSLDIDWTAVKTNYLTGNDNGRAERTTAHYYKGGWNSVDSSDTTSAFKMLKKANEEASLNYRVYLTREVERETLKNTYFNETSEDGYITFDWDNDSSKNAFEALFNGTPIDKSANGESYTYVIDDDSLAKAGLKIKWDSKVNNGAEGLVTSGRLSDFIALSGNYEHVAKNLDNTPELFDDFLDNCSIWGVVNPRKSSNNAKEYSSLNKVFIDYSNSLYETNSTDEIDSHCVLDQSYTNRFQVTKEAYDFLTSEFNIQMDFLDTYKNNRYEDEYEAALDDVVLEAIMFAVNVLFTAQTVAFCFVPIFAGHIPVYMVILAFTIISLIGQAIILGLLVTNKLKPLEKFKNTCDDIKNNEDLNYLFEVTKESQESNYLCRYDENSRIKQSDYNDGFSKFQGEKTDFFDNVLPAIEYYQHLDINPSMVRFMDLLHDKDIAPQTYSNTMDVWDSNGWCQIANWIILGVTFALDMTTLALMGPLPEMRDWKLCKDLCNQARREGKSYSSVFKTYQNIQRTKKIEAEVATWAAKQEKAFAMKSEGGTKIYARDISNFLYEVKRGKIVGEYDGFMAKQIKKMPRTNDFPKIVEEIGAGSQRLDPGKLAYCARKMADEKKMSFSKILRTLLYNKETPELNKQGKYMLQMFTKNFRAIIQTGPEVAGTAYIQTAKLLNKLLSEPGKDLLYAVLDTTEAALKLNRLDDAYKALEGIEKVLYDSSFWSQEILRGDFDLATQFGELFKYPAQSLDYFYQTIMKKSKITSYVIVA